MTVYAVQVPERRDPQTRRIVPRYDLSPAHIYGDVEVLLSPTAKPFRSKPIIEELYQKLKDFGDDDYVICIGNPILLALTVSIAVDINDGRAKLLQWHGHTEEYVPVEVDLGFTSASE